MKANNTPAFRAPKPVTKEQIAALAHELWLAQGCPAASDLDIWLEAEQQLQGKTPVRPLHRDPIPADPDRIDPDEDPALGNEVDAEIRAVGNRPQPRSPTAL